MLSLLLDVFGGLSWAYGEGHLLYVAEKKVKTTSFFDPKYDPTSIEPNECENVVRCNLHSCTSNLTPCNLALRLIWPPVIWPSV